MATFALTPQGPGVVELNKMAVRDDFSRKALGNAWMRFALMACKAHGLRVIELYSHTKLKSALHIYRTFGFTDIGGLDEANAALSWIPPPLKHHERSHLHPTH